ncbi:hypothetical protein H6G45_09205 [Synechocystis sp. FACHB-383]|uniref:hypothetical protein n=1 Tax=Synechocystis sp. FACHB-383 TaxID=2692864 RepID=UPI0016855813|nr:hypothetical protein [Synechocystis sp. FACHB-383]MBD2653663.1 hypothetical protein [Synechocystis sp. FACHB-383]
MIESDIQELKEQAIELNRQIADQLQLIKQNQKLRNEQYAKLDKQMSETQKIIDSLLKEKQPQKNWTKFWQFADGYLSPSLLGLAIGLFWGFFFY